MRVLIVSPDAVERLRAASALRRDGDMEIIERATALEGHHVALEEDLDVIVVDADLAPEGGFSMLYELRAAAQLAGRTTAPAVVLTSRVQDGFLADWAGANATVPKPVDAFDLAAAVHRVARQPAAAPSAVDGPATGGAPA